MNRQGGRRGFMKLSGAGIAALVGGVWPDTATASEGQGADLVVFNGKVYAVDSQAPKVEAFAVKTGRFTNVGNTAEIKALIGKGTQTINPKQIPTSPTSITCPNPPPRTV